MGSNYNAKASILYPKLLNPIMPSINEVKIQIIIALLI